MYIYMNTCQTWPLRVLFLIFFLYFQFGVIVLTTANGILDHEEARRKKVGGKVLGKLRTGS